MNNVYGRPEYSTITAKLKSELLDLKERVGDTDEEYPALMTVRENAW